MKKKPYKLYDDININEHAIVSTIQGIITEEKKCLLVKII